MKTIKLILILVLTLTFFGCSSDKEAIDTGVMSNSIISMYEFSTQNNLTAENAAGGYLFTRPGVRLQIYPHVKYIRYNGRTLSIPDAPFVSSGKLFLPLSLIEALPDSFNIKKATTVDAFVLLDPGHGGEDTGAISAGAFEKDIVLDIARRTQRILTESGIPSELTRKDDHFITLDERSKIANRHPGAIFISIHANAESSGKADGIETFYLTSKISDKQRAKWASTEYDFNTAGGRLTPKLELITAEKMSYEIRNKSKVLAQLVQSSIISNLHETDRGVKQENFSVLRESFFGPAILIETGFVTHPITRKKLLTPNYRQKMAENIARGIVLYIKRN